VLAALPFVVLILFMGLKPQPILDVLRPSTDRFVARARYASGQAPQVEEDGRVKVYVRPLPADVMAQADVPQEPPSAAALPSVARPGNTRPPHLQLNLPARALRPVTPPPGAP